MPAPTPLDATVGNVARVREVVSAAFADDPLFLWLFPDDVTRPDAMAAWIGLFVEAFATSAVIDVVVDDDGVIAGAALWRLGDASVTFPTVPSVGGLLVALVGPDDAVSKGYGLRAFTEHKPAQPYHYLQFLTVHPDYQGRGIGRQLVAHGLDRAAAADVGVYLESTNPVNLGFYRAMGLAEVDCFDLRPAGPRAYCMWWSA